MKDYYTKLIYEHKMIDEDKPTIITIERGAWDLDGSDLLEMFHGIFIGATYAEDTFRDTLINYLESRGYTVMKDDEINE